MVTSQHSPQMDGGWILLEVDMRMRLLGKQGRTRKSKMARYENSDRFAMFNKVKTQRVQGQLARDKIA